MNLYKYLTPEKVELMLQGKIFLTPPKYLNDPWEFFYHVEEQPEERIRAQFEAADQDSFRFMSKLASPNWYQQLPKEKRWEIFRERVTSDEFRTDEPSYYRERISESQGVLSLSEDPMNRLMWAHYGGLNQGIVVGFKTGSEESLHGIVARPTPFGPAMKVTYATNRPEVSLDPPNGVSVFTTKHPDWENEKEWRVILPLLAADSWEKDGNTFYSLPCRPECVSHVVFGLSTDEALKNRVKEWLEKGTGDSKEILLIEQAKIDPKDQKFYAE